MKNKKQKACCLFLVLCTIVVWGQNNDIPELPRPIPPTPQAAQFIRYGEIPVGHTTGVPQIEVPIYTLSTGWIDIPISISYHASGFRPREIPISVGLGWVLNAGGMISRAIEVLPDFEALPDDMPVKSEADIWGMKTGTYQPVGVYWFNSIWCWENLILNPQQNHSQIDTRSDRYSYNFLGNAGIARYNVNTKKLIPVPYAPLIINRIAIDHYVITDAKGIKYEFTVPEKTSYQISDHTFFPATSTGWHLSKISYPGMENDPVVFSYKNAEGYGEVISSRTISILKEFTTGSNFTCEQCGGCPGDSQKCPKQWTTNSSLNSIFYSYDSQIITSIKWKNVSIEFNYSDDRQDKRKERLTTIVVKHGNNIVRQAVIDNNDYFGSKPKSLRLKLNSISLYGNNTATNGEVYSFNYNYSSGVPEYGKIGGEDLWGYFNNSNDHLIPIEIAQHLKNTYPSAWLNPSIYPDRKPNEAATKTCVLEEIVYPTKGKTRFEYEINRIPGFYVNIGDSLSDMVGGLRLKKRINYSETGTVLDIKEYRYEGYGTMPLSYDMFIGELQTKESYGMHEHFLARLCADVTYKIATSSSMLSLTGWSASPVFYNKVIEYNGENAIFSGKTEYFYTAHNFPDDIPSVCKQTFSPWYFSVYNDCDKGHIKELLDSIKIYNQSEAIVRKTANTYQFYNIPYIPTGVHVKQLRLFPNGFDPWMAQAIVSSSCNEQSYYQNYFLGNIVAVNTYAKQEIHLLQSTTDTEYVNGAPAISKTSSYVYDTKDDKPILFTPFLVIQENSDGETWVSKSVFPYDDAYKNTAPYNIMVGKNMLDFPVEVKTGKGIKIINKQPINQRFTTYKQVADMILPDAISIKYTGDTPVEQRITYHEYDVYGNPVYISKDNAERVVYLWAYRGQYPVAEIVNAAYDEVENILGATLISRLASEDEPASNDLAAVNNLRNSLPNALVTTYTYKPLIGKATVTDPNNITVYYEYDDLGRLKTIKDQHNNILQQNEYHYKQ
ncbi:MAG: hypothetical protein FWH23_03570 [Bacteroidales bacterium]|nr:hypothetical protein [Bacteroidales bacterium]MCL2133384.1 hypothetical protein [Bacteroidales bacterium]